MSDENSMLRQESRVFFFQIQSETDAFWILSNPPPALPPISSTSRHSWLTVNNMDLTWRMESYPLGLARESDVSLQMSAVFSPKQTRSDAPILNWDERRGGRCYPRPHKDPETAPIRWLFRYVSARQRADSDSVYETISGAMWCMCLFVCMTVCQENSGGCEIVCMCQEFVDWRQWSAQTPFQFSCKKSFFFCCGPANNGLILPQMRNTS